MEPFLLFHIVCAMLFDFQVYVAECSIIIMIIECCLMYTLTLNSDVMNVILFI